MEVDPRGVADLASEDLAYAWCRSLRTMFKPLTVVVVVVIE